MQMDTPLVARKVRLGPTLQVSQVCFGTEHIIKYSPRVGGQMLADAARLHGVSFWDTAPIYKSQPHVAAGLRLMPREDVTVCSKTYAESAADAEKHLDAILSELGTDYLDLCLLHRIMPGRLWSRLPALEVLLKAKDAGKVRSVGLSTHSPSIVIGGAQIPEIEVICATLNSSGHSLDEGTPEDMVDALRFAQKAGKGTYVIKVLGMGTLTHNVQAALEWVMQFHDCIDVYNIGVASLDELREDLSLVNSFYSRNNF